jgi:hypothetical protein
VLYLAYRHHDDFEAAVVANTNAGGENCHRGSALGALVGASVGDSGISDRFIRGLADGQRLGDQISTFAAMVAADEDTLEDQAVELEELEEGELDELEKAGMNEKEMKGYTPDLKKLHDEMEVYLREGLDEDEFN